ncbi:MAG: DUF2071 domain-containing protein [Planctomycetaceae bacterium]|nr:DUF2071 domain-containing protein [Planctomycetaceae bacterium]
MPEVLTEPSLDVRLAQRRRPDRRLAMYQTWRELLFIHWEVDADVIQASLPEGLTVDTYNGQAYVGLVPFFMRNIRPWWGPRVPGISNFLELNCRTYVIGPNGVPGVWFYSLDTDSRLTVWGARKYYHLPYHLAAMSHHYEQSSGRVEFSSHRNGTSGEFASRFVYQPDGEAIVTDARSLEFFLVERYILFAQSPDGRFWSGTVHHPPYEVSPVSVEEWDDSLFPLNDFPQPQRPFEHALMCRGVDVDVFSLEPLPAI